MDSTTSRYRFHETIIHDSKRTYLSRRKLYLSFLLEESSFKVLRMIPWLNASIHIKSGGTAYGELTDDRGSNGIDFITGLNSISLSWLTIPLDRNMWVHVVPDQSSHTLSEPPSRSIGRAVHVSFFNEHAGSTLEIPLDLTVIV